MTPSQDLLEWTLTGERHLPLVLPIFNTIQSMLVGINSASVSLHARDRPRSPCQQLFSPLPSDIASRVRR
jgi:hypothetical protein